MGKENSYAYLLGNTTTASQGQSNVDNLLIIWVQQPTTQWLVLNYASVLRVGTPGALSTAWALSPASAAFRVTLPISSTAEPTVPLGVQDSAVIQLLQSQNNNISAAFNGNNIPLAVSFCMQRG